MAGRPKTLTAAIVPVMAATALVVAYQRPLEAVPWRWWISALAIAAAICIQIGTNLINDAIDFKKGADTEKRIGPKRVTQSGLMSAKSVMALGLGFFAMATLCGIPLVFEGGWPICAVGLFSLFFGYAYTGGPFPLAYRGWGDVFVILFFGLIAVEGVLWLHLHELTWPGFVLGLQIGMHATVLIAINNLRDRETDVLVNKRTLPVRFGVQFARWEIAVMALGPFVLQACWWFWGKPQMAVLGFLPLPLAVGLVKKVFTTEPGPAYNRFLGMAAGLHFLFGLIVTIGFLL